MAVRRWDPFRDLLGIQNEMNRLFGRTYGPGASAEAETQGSWVPPLDIIEVAKAAQAKPVRVEVKAGPGSPGGGEMSGSPLGKERG